jgi:hypothetical protein
MSERICSGHAQTDSDNSFLDIFFGDASAFQVYGMVNRQLLGFLRIYMGLVSTNVIARS